MSQNTLSLAVSNTLPSPDYETIGRGAREQSAHWRKQLNTNIDKHPEFNGFIHDIAASGQLYALPDAVLGRIVAAATAANLKKLGYPGAASNDGRTLCPFMTVLLRRLRLVFGDEVVWDKRVGVTKETEWTYGAPRGFKAEPEVLLFWTNELNTLVMKLLAM